MLTVIIPTYNSEKTLANCLDSLLRQTFQDFKVQIIDGVSTDSTLDIIKTYQSKFSQYSWVSEPDKGIYDAMNKGVKRVAKGYLYFMGSDDSLYKDTVFENLISSPYYGIQDVIYGQVFSEKDQDFYDGPFTYLKLYNKNICHQAIFLKKEVFDTIGLYDLKYKLLADWDHNIRWFYSKKISHIYIDLVVAHYAYGGLSYQSRDEAFRKDKPTKFLIKGLGRLPVSVMCGVYEKIIKNNSEEYSTLQILGIRFLKTILTMLLAIRNLFR